MHPPSSVHRPALRISVVADSIAMPQDHQGERLRLEETWPSQLQTLLRRAGRDAEVLNRGMRNRHSYDLGDSEFQEHVGYTEPDVLILSLGVNDSAPRLFTLRQKATMNRPWFPRWLRERIIRHYSKNRIRIIEQRGTRICHSTPEEFGANVARFLGRCAAEHPSCRAIVLPIFCDPVKVNAKTPGFAESTYRYNRVLGEVAAKGGHLYVEQARLLPEELRVGGDLFLPDGFHLNPVGSGRVAAELARIVLELDGGPSSGPRR